MDINVRDADNETRDQQRMSNQEGGRSASLIENSRNGEGMMLQSSKKAGDTKEDFSALQELKENQEQKESQ